jgi:hypothetical protein
MYCCWQQQLPTFPAQLRWKQQIRKVTVGQQLQQQQGMLSWQQQMLLLLLTLGHSWHQSKQQKSQLAAVQILQVPQ